MVLVPVSHWLNNIIAESFLKEFPRKVIYNGVDISTFFPQDISDIRKKYRLEGRHVLLGVATTWSERKGLPDYLQLSRTLKDDEVIVLVGLREKQIEKLPPRIMGIKRTENLNELAALYSLADVVCNLSVEETFGLTTVEGFACGTPGIVYNCTASPELINSDTGFIVEAGDIEGVRSAVDVIRNRGKSSYSSACRERAVKMFNKDSQYEQYIQLYEELLANK
jgi:glycosyltransferase involved in cell wall biosynthesis